MANQMEDVRKPTVEAPSLKTEQSNMDDEGRVGSSNNPKSKLTATSSTTTKSPRLAPHKSPSQSITMKNILHEVREMKDRIRKLEDEVATLHELLKVQDDITAETLAILPDSFKDARESSWKKHSNAPPMLDYRPQKDHHKLDRPKESGSMNNSVSQAMMMNNYAWYGDAFLYELLCQFKGYHPKEDNWFTSVHPFVAFETFCKRMFHRNSFFRACIVCIGYSDLFNAKAVTGYPMKQTLHALLNYMNEHGAAHIKVLSIPPARQMMKNHEYLKICQTTNKFLKAITKTHNFVEFVNLDSFFVNNPNDFFNYITAENEVQVQISDQLLMRKVNDHFEITLDADTARTVIDHLCDPNTTNRGYQSSNSNAGYGNKRHLDNVSSPNYPAKRIHKSRPEDEDDYDQKHFYRPSHSDRRYSDYEHDGPQDDNDYKHNYDYRQQRSSSKSDRNSPPPWLKK